MLYSQFKTDLKKKLQRHCAEANLSVSADLNLYDERKINNLKEA